MRPTRSAELLGRVFSSGALAPHDVATALGATESEIADYASGKLAMPARRQLAFASLVLARVPGQKRLAASLKAQATAAIAFEDIDISSSAQPVGWKPAPVKR